MVYIPRLITDIISLAFVGALFFGFIDPTIIGFGHISILTHLSLIFFIVLAGIYVIDFFFYGPPMIIVIIITLVLATLALQNWAWGLASAIFLFILALLMKPFIKKTI